MDVFKLLGTIAIDSQDANKSIDDTTKKAQLSQGKITAAFSKVGNAVVNAYQTDAPKQFNEALTELTETLEEHEDQIEDATAETKQFDRSLGKVSGQADKTGNALNTALRKIGSAVATAFATQKIFQFGTACTEVYASIAAEESAFAQIMGDYADTAQEKLEAVGQETGITSTRMISHMTSLTAKFKGLGYDVEDATTLAADGLLIAADASAFWDMSLEDSVSHLNSFINGSYEGGEAIGLFANDTQMAAYAVEEGIVKDTKAWSELDEATKQATRLDYAKNMMEQAGATGQAAKEADAYANVKANLLETWRQFQSVIGEPLLQQVVLPAMQTLLDLMPGLITATEDAIAFLSACITDVTYWINDFISWLQTGGIEADLFKAAIFGVAASMTVLIAFMSMKAIYEGFVATIGLIKTAFTALNAVMAANPLLLIISLVVGLVVAFVYLWNTSEEFRNFWIDAWEVISSAVSDAVDTIGDFIETIVGWWNSVTSAIDSANEALEKFLGMSDAKEAIRNSGVSIFRNSGTVSSDFVGSLLPGWSVDGSNVSGSGTEYGGSSGAKKTILDSGVSIFRKQPDGSNYTGLDYVPRDNYLSYLHQGEAVLTRNEADAWRSGSMGNTSKLEAALGVVADLLQEVVQNTGAGQQIVLDSGVLVGQLAPGIDSQLGAISNRKGRRN